MAGRHRRVLPARRHGARLSPCSRPTRHRHDDVSPDHVLGWPRLRLSTAGTCVGAPPTITACSSGARATPTPRHRPPTVRRRDRAGPPGRLLARRRRDGRAGGSACTTTRCCCPKQVIEKCDYYAHADWARRAGAARMGERGVADASTARSAVHNVLRATRAGSSATRGPHPAEVRRMVAGLRAAGGSTALRHDSRYRPAPRLPLVPRSTGAVIRGLDPWDRRARGSRRVRAVRPGSPAHAAGAASLRPARRQVRPGALRLDDTSTRRAAVGRPGLPRGPGRGRRAGRLLAPPAGSGARGHALVDGDRRRRRQRSDRS